MPTVRILPPRNLGTLPGEPPLAFTHANPLDPGFEREIPAGAAAVAWAGWFDPAADPAGGLFPSDHRLWTQGLVDLRQALARLEPVLRERDALLFLRPACGLVLSDPHSLAALLGDAPGDRLRILLDPVAMLTPGMARHAQDHIPRMFDKLARFDACSAVVLSGGMAATGDRLTRRPLDSADPLDAELLRAWRESPLAERDVLVQTDACRALIEQGAIA